MASERDATESAAPSKPEPATRPPRPLPVPVEETDPSPADDARFDFTEVVDEDTVVIFDFGGMETRIKRTLTLVLLSNLWTAIKAREERTPSDADTPQVNLYLEEAKDVADTELVDTLLAQGRSFDLSVTLGVQFLEQLDSPDPSNNTYREALNETATFVVGNVAVDRHLPDVLATGDMSPSEVERRLGALRRGEWLVRRGAGFGEPSVRPFLGESLPAPPGHPASDDTLVGRDRRAFEDAVESLQDRTREQAGIEIGEPSTIDHEFGTTDEDVDADALPRVDTLLPYTKRLPGCVDYDESAHAIRCEGCDNRYNASAQGMMQAIDCCHFMSGIDPDDFPICDFNLSLASEGIVASEYSPRELCFMQAVYNAQQNNYERPEYDIARDSMIRIQEYAGIDTDDVEQLVDDGLVTRDTDRPYRLYSLTPDGRDVIQEPHSLGVAFGHGKGDLDESSEHDLGVEVSDRWATREFAKNPDSDVVTIRPYYDLKEGSIDADAFFGGDEAVEDAADDFEHHRLDLVGLDEDGEIVLTIEVERINHDTRRAVPDDYDKMATCDPDEAIWVVMSHQDAHEVLAALNDPLDGDPRVEKTYSEGTPTQSMQIDEPGLTDIYTVAQLRDEIIDE
ncbi:hypothetical protein [Halosimplex sp. TS25]|uniref:hypothetical protein n=1 Tax=Halosimplex rarum TaxID=3396619 RepID=UPI0039E7EE52